jgi:Uma2 family endonuclease
MLNSLIIKCLYKFLIPPQYFTKKIKMNLTAAQKAKTPKSSGKKIPQGLIYEILDGEILYYKGYQAVLKNQKNIEEIMGSSTLQALLVAFFSQILFKNLNEDLYYIFTSEAGLHLDHRNNLANDIAVYETSVLTPDKITTQYADVPPQMVIEIDIKADLSADKDYEYVQTKTKKLLQFGTQKVIWVFTKTQMVLVAQPNENWQTIDWQKDIELILGVYFNIGDYLSKKGVKLDE